MAKAKSKAKAKPEVTKKNVDIVSGAVVKAPDSDAREHDKKVEEIKIQAKTPESVQVSQIIGSDGLVTLYDPNFVNADGSKGAERRFNPVDATDLLRSGDCLLKKEK